MYAHRIRRGRFYFSRPAYPETKTPGPFRPGAADSLDCASVVLEASRRAGALVAPPVRIGRGEAVVAERLVDVFAPALGHVAGVAQALIANLVRPAAEELVLAPGARQERAEKKPGRKSGDADQHRVLVHEALHRAAVLAHVGQGAADGLELAGALVIGAARPLGCL